MLGLGDPWIVAAYVLCVASAVLCVGYGLRNWNKGEEPVQKEDVDWAKQEKAEVEPTV